MPGGGTSSPPQARGRVNKGTSDKAENRMMGAPNRSLARNPIGFKRAAELVLHGAIPLSKRCPVVGAGSFVCEPYSSRQRARARGFGAKQGEPEYSTASLVQKLRRHFEGEISAKVRVFLGVQSLAPSVVASLCSLRAPAGRAPSGSSRSSTRNSASLAADPSAMARPSWIPSSTSSSSSCSQTRATTASCVHCSRRYCGQHFPARKSRCSTPR